MKKKIGEISVDAGCVWIGDPCYALHGERPDEIGKTWDEFCKILEDKGHDEKEFSDFGFTGVCVASGYGDGVYPVIADFNDEGKITSVTIDFQ